ncbi:hypothetical protein CFC21_091036 [Triticum aestivum]|uniref:Uncharacterized protein n=2 Tax=Triticum aestivum TaxID=4565 RepID=A0A9R1LFG2_WHEAT|nr:uncharacterized ATP-dependent helicase YprA-like [Aegilops tauschii subsp. strangulata]XP_044417230.1 uncharacterized ATP-dependent helicase YprA-like [Triticum aestivum]KAF7087864.1 hypothetical protein CFC21_091025 [Triticum aestivum]KAF7087875.1 hypothetical protein CFC21_091036 [Triticum aestivum]
MAQRQQQETKAIPVRSLDGRTTTVRLAAACSVDDLKAALRASNFPPPAGAPTFHLFLKGAKLLPQAKVGNLPIYAGDFVSLIPFTAKPTTPAPFGRHAFSSSPWAAAGTRRKLPGSWSGGGDDDVYAPNKVARPSSSSCSNHCGGTEPLDPAQMVEHLRRGLGKHGQIAHVERMPGSEATFADDDLLHRFTDAMRSCLRSTGVTRLYAHQAQAVRAAVAGKHVVVSTSTSSGKSLCYNVPVLESVVSSPAACALYVFPTKALAQDQLKALLQMKAALLLAGAGDFGVEIYDGDTPVQDRARIRQQARVLITNPDMLHASILPCHGQFRRILSGLAHVVVDEAHTYRGAFGCQAALVLRRLRRLCADVYGRRLIFVFCTATLANPREHVMELAGVDEMELVDQDGSPRGVKHFVLWNSSSASKSPVTEVSRLVAEMVQHGLRCIAFCKTRKLCEQVLAAAREVLEEAVPAAPELASSVCVYRGGYVASDRRKIEADLFSGRLRGVAATNALELGIDVGHVDATLHLGFPGSIASLWQQAGRSGRRSKDSIAVYVAFDGAVDQYFMNYPDKLFGKPIERCHVDAQNQKVLRQHLACAAVENQLRSDRDEPYFGSTMNDAITFLKDKGILTINPTGGNTWKYAGPVRRPSQSVSIRAIEHGKFTVTETASKRVLEEIEQSKAFFQVHEGAVYMHQGVSYLVDRLDLSSRTAYCGISMSELCYHTKTEDYTDIDVAAPADPSGVRADECTVTTRWVGYRRIFKTTDQVSDVIPLHLPSYSFDTQAVWATIPQTVWASIEQSKLWFRGGLHGAAHAILSILPLHMMCGSGDLGTECVDPQETRKRDDDRVVVPDRILLYDKHPGGIGLASQARTLFGDLLVAALELVSACGCHNSDGCPNCVQSFACRDTNKNLDKEAAVALLKGLIQWHSELKPS